MIYAIRANKYHSERASEKTEANLPEDLEDRRDRYRQAAALLRQWREDDSGYDEKIWPLIEEEFKLKDP